MYMSEAKLSSHPTVRFGAIHIPENGNQKINIGLVLGLLSIRALLNALRKLRISFIDWLMK